MAERRKNLNIHVGKIDVEGNSTFTFKPTTKIIGGEKNEKGEESEKREESEKNIPKDEEVKVKEVEFEGRNFVGTVNVNGQPLKDPFN